MFWNKYVSCEECKHVIEKKDAHVVSIMHQYWYKDETRMEKYYCNMHKKAYDRKVYTVLGSIVYSARVEVSADGVPVGYRKEVASDEFALAFDDLSQELKKYSRKNKKQ